MFIRVRVSDIDRCSFKSEIKDVDRCSFKSEVGI